MTLDELLAEVIGLLQRQGRVSYWALRKRFALDDDDLEGLKDELVVAQQLAVDEQGKVLVWVGDTTSVSPSTALASEQKRAPLAYTPPHLAQKILTARPALEGERKQVTVMFADIKDSTELIRDLDPEAAQQLLDPAIHIMMDAVHRFEGTVNQVLGDGIMAIFGAPLAHEDHALRSCYAALAMQAAMQDYTEQVRRAHGIEMRIRVGLNAGEVVVRAIGNDLHTDYSAVGQTTHLAARMEQLATPGSIRLSADTFRLVEGLMHVNPLGPIPVKGMSEPVAVYELIGASFNRRRLQAAVARGLTRFIGRDTEMKAITQACDRAAAGHGQVVAAVGEAGVGKSRLVYEFVHSHHTKGWRVLESASVSYGKATPYFPVVELLKRYVGVEDGDEPRIRRARVTGQIMTLDKTLEAAIPVLLFLLDALPEDDPFLQLDPPQRRQRTLQALKRILLRESQVQPLLLVFEDLHWIDTETQALLDGLIESSPTAQLLLLVNYRPEYQHSWGSKTFYTQLRLDPLPAARADAFLDALLGEQPGLAPLKQLLIERTHGNPFFLEESVRMLVETQALHGEPGAYRLVQDLPAIQVPPTVQTILAARIDRLSAADKQLLQTAAVVGTEVPLSVLQAIADTPQTELQQGLAHLQAAEFIYEASLFPEHIYTFKHALTHEVAYSSLLQERRRMLHARIMDTLEAVLGERLVDQVEVLAYHALRGELWDKALTYYRQAGAKAQARSAYREVVVCIEQALTALQHLPENRKTREVGVDLRIDLRNALLPLGELGQVLDTLREAEALAAVLQDQRRLGLIARHIARHFWNMGELERSVEAGRHALRLATELGDFALQVTAHVLLGTVYYTLGDYHQAIDVFRQNVASLQGELRYTLYEMAGHPAVVSRLFLAVCLAEIGVFSEGTQYADEAVQIVETVDHAFSLCLAYLSSGVVRLQQGDIVQAIPWLERARSICQDANIGLNVASTAAALGYGYALSGQIAKALPLLEAAVERSTDLAGIDSPTLRMTYLSEAYVLADRLEDANRMALRAHALAVCHKERRCEAYALRLLADIAAHGDAADSAQAEDYYRQAIALTEELGMRPLLAHCHYGLGVLYGRKGQLELTRSELSTAVDLYRSMQMTFWLPQTEAALAQVGGTESV